MSRPRVSVIMPSYNHGAVVMEAVESVLSQDFSDFEFFIEDDGSTDTSHDLLSAIQDSRVNVALNLHNQGAGTVTARLIARTRGDYIALINSDDVWEKHKLSQQLGLLDRAPDVAAAFSTAKFIDHLNRPVAAGSTPLAAGFPSENRLPGQWLRHFLYYGNALCNPSVLVRRTALVRTGGYDPRLRQLPDFALWVRMAKRERFYVDPEPLVRFRIMPSGLNASAVTPANTARGLVEHLMIAETLLDGVDNATLQEGFADLLRFPDLPTRIHAEAEKALLYLTSPVDSALSAILDLAAYRRLSALLGLPDSRGVLDRDYAITEKTLHELGARAGALLLKAHR